EETARRLALEPLLDRTPAQLSGGQRQRVALGRALVRDPAVFLFDEPLSNLDAALRVQLRAELVALHAALGATMLYVTHDQVEALTMGQRLAVLDGGVLQQVGTPAEIYGRPANVFVARFVGVPGMNLVAGAAMGAFLGDGLAVSVPGIPPEAAVLGVRPEQVTLAAPGTGHADGAVEAVERLGSETLVHVRTLAGRIAARLPGLVDAKVGDAVAVRFDEARLHWFDAEGRRIDG
ncbi:MAG TPA: TOBE domain-containing protein, partial [Gemmatimonadales bacterium]|nr:TOBE domain-containing protein [Gemmatimonadales bacterium]